MAFPTVTVIEPSPGSLPGDPRWTEEMYRWMLVNPIYAGVGPTEGAAYVTDRFWVRSSALMMREEGIEQVLVNMLYALRQSLGPNRWLRAGHGAPGGYRRGPAGRGAEGAKPAAARPERTGPPPLDLDIPWTLPPPRVVMPPVGRLGKSAASITPAMRRWVRVNPILTGIGPWEELPSRSEEEWIRDAVRLIEEDGPEQFLVDMLTALRDAMRIFR